MLSYFFIPANSMHKLEKSNSLNADYIIADLEDAVAHQDYNIAIDNLLESTDLKIDYVRVDPDRIESDERHNRLFDKYRKIIYPKICDDQSLDKFIQLTQTYELDFVLLIEHPWLLLNIKDLMGDEKYGISKIAFGNHDYSKQMNVDVYSEIIHHARMQVATIAAAYAIEAIDVASMELTNEDVFTNECIRGKEMSYSGKFIIHPRQLQWFNSVEFYSRSQIEWAEKVVNILGSSKDETAISTLDGQVIEKPHLLKALHILKQKNT